MAYVGRKKPGVYVVSDDIKKYQKQFKDLDIGVAVGIPEDAPAHPTSKLSTVQIAIINEFGNPNNTLYGNAAPIPARPFVGGSTEKHKKKYSKLMTKALRKYAGMKKASPAALLSGMKAIGQIAKNDMYDYITDSSNFEENRPYTTDKKDSDKPLIDTGHLRSSVRYRVETKKKRGASK